jgi:hypothetical protein
VPTSRFAQGVLSWLMTAELGGPWTRRHFSLNLRRAHCPLRKPFVVTRAAPKPNRLFVSPYLSLTFGVVSRRVKNKRKKVRNGKEKNVGS